MDERTQCLVCGVSIDVPRFTCRPCAKTHGRYGEYPHGDRPQVNSDIRSTDGDE